MRHTLSHDGWIPYGCHGSALQEKVQNAGDVPEDEKGYRGDVGPSPVGQRYDSVVEKDKGHFGKE